MSDRLDFKHSSFGTGYDYLTSKFQTGNTYSNGKEDIPLDRIISYGMTNAGCSYLGAVNDILTGSLRYIANEENHEIRSKIISKLAPCMAKTKTGIIREEGFTLRPYNKDKLPDEVVAEYELLRAFLNKNFSSPT